jgi:hypothetical protein
MSAAFPGKVSRWQRTARLADRVKAVVRDEIEAPRPVEVAWGVTTDAEIAVKGRRAAMTKQRRDMLAEIVSPEGAVFEIASAAQPEPQARNQGGCW